MKLAYLTILLLVTAAPLSAQQAAAEADCESASPTASVWKYQGLSSCASSGCHGGGQIIRGAQFASYVHWWQNDHAHRNAWRTLQSDLSKSIVERLHHGQSGEVLPAERDLRCLACHSTGVDLSTDLSELLTADRESAAAPAAPFSVTQSRIRLEDGVQCEACHGAAEGWLAKHSRPEWKDLTASQKLQTAGFVSLENLLERARVCSECHIGGVGRDMNHDMIAAGHPRLDFELATFHSRLPVHWDQQRDQLRIAGRLENESRDSQAARFETRVWVAGQLQSARQTLKLLEYRASADHGVWPEFAEYDCYACHHTLAGPAWRQQRGSAGSLLWSDWNTSLSPLAAELIPGASAGLRTQLQDLRTVMQQSYPERRETARTAVELQTRLCEIMSEFDFGGTVPAASTKAGDSDAAILLRRVLDETDQIGSRGWDNAAQTYLALVALRRHVPAVTDQRISVTEFDERLRQLRQTLLFQTEDSEQGWRLQSPDLWRSAEGRVSDQGTHPDLKVWDELRRELSGDE